MLLDAQTLRLKKVLPVKEESDIIFAMFSPDGRALMTIGEVQGTKFWNVRAGAMPSSSPASSFPWDSFEREGKNLRWHWGVRDAAGVHVLKTVVLPVGNIRDGIPMDSPSGKLLAFGEGDSWRRGPYLVQVWDLRGAKMLHEFAGHTKDVLELCFSPDERLLASTDQTGRVNVWNISPLSP